MENQSMCFFRFPIIGVLTVFCLLTSCYKQERFDFPGPYDDLDVREPDTLPFPFDPDREAGVWLMKDGEPDYGRILFKGYTDYFPAGDTLSWVKDPDGYRMIPHRNYYPITDDDHFGGNPNSFQFNWAYSKYFVPVGEGKSFYMYAKVTFGTFSGTAAGLVLGRSWDTGGVFIFGMDGSSNVAPTFFVDLYGRLGATVSPDQGWPTVNEVIVPGIPAEIEVVIHDGQFYVIINGTLCFWFKPPHEQTYWFTPQIRPWRNFITVHDFYLESDEMYTVDYAMHENEGGYKRIQSPALAKAPNGDLLLFAEGRSNPTSAIERVAQNTRAIGNTDIIMRRSSSGGMSWDEDISVIAGQGSNETFAFPQTVTTSDGKIILHYSKIANELTGSNYTYNAESQVVYQIESTNNGQSWSSPVDITASLRDAAGYMRSGPGHGIELSATAYSKRLVMPIAYGNNRIRAALSDDGGQTWRLSSYVGGNNMTQGTVVELSDSRLMMVLTHSNVSPARKLVSYSEDGGETWSTPVNIDAGMSTSTFGHMYPGIVVKGNNGNIYAVNPTGRETDNETYNSPVYALSPVLFRSENDGQSFTSAGQLFDKMAYRPYASPIGAMDAVVLDDGRIVIVGEGGVESPQEGIVVYHK